MNDKAICRTYKSGTKWWLLWGVSHRENGPAIVWAEGTKSWWINGKRHRKDGPAIERQSGSKEWYLYDKKYTEKEFNHLTQKK